MGLSWTTDVMGMPKMVNVMGLISGVPTLFRTFLPSYEIRRDLYLLFRLSCKMYKRDYQAIYFAEVPMQFLHSISTFIERWRATRVSNEPVEPDPYDEFQPPPRPDGLPPCHIGWCKPCSNPALPGKDFCILHLPDENKDEEQFRKAFEEELRRQEGAKRLDLDLEHIVIPIPFVLRDVAWDGLHGIAATGTHFIASADFHGYHFKSPVGFQMARFSDNAIFANCKFDAEAQFNCMEFKASADFSAATFFDKACFRSTRFGEASFPGATFCTEADFGHNSFYGKAIFFECDFKQKAYFWNCSFEDWTDFDQARFCSYASFFKARFHKKPSFNKTVFLAKVNFTKANYSPFNDLVR